MILKSTKNALLDTIRQHMDPALFEGIDQKEDYGVFAGFIIRLKGTPLEFKVQHAANDHHWLNCGFVQFNPVYTWSEFFPSSTSFLNDLVEIQKYLQYWLRDHVTPFLEEVATPDLWQTITDERSSFGSTVLQPGDLAAFTNDEKLRTKQAIAEFERRIHATFHPNPEQAEAITAQLRYLADAVDRLNHFDWRSLLLSTVIGISTTLGLDTETGRQLFDFAKQIFSGALKYLPG